MKYLNKTDPQMDEIIKKEIERQENSLMMIPSENHTSEAVRTAVGSILQDKYCEGYIPTNAIIRAKRTSIN
ncbi:MAG: hypothetical protein ACKKMV_02670 [Candidatus Nealsonbacteria bacterium]